MNVSFPDVPWTRLNEVTTGVWFRTAEHARHRPLWLAHQFGSTETDGLRQSQSWDGTSGTLLDVARSPKSACQMFPQSEVSEKLQGYLQNIFKSCDFRNFLWSFTIVLPGVLPSSDGMGYPGIQPWLWRKLPMTDTDSGHWIGKTKSRRPSERIHWSQACSNFLGSRRDGTFSDPLHGI